ncbi:hypothetical protein OSCI_1600006 [Kamptonema sp. PCC 6506]|nr:hypothetical protein OSCI_1600006 [Kamptonema sp. PCC 6506]
MQQTPSRPQIETPNPPEKLPRKAAKKTAKKTGAIQLKS